jgi:hypothetical protein
VAKLEEIKRGTRVQGILPNKAVHIIDTKWHGEAILEVTYKDDDGALGNDLLFRFPKGYFVPKASHPEIAPHACSGRIPAAECRVLYCC